MTIQCARCGQTVETKPRSYNQRYCQVCAAIVRSESVAKCRRKKAQAKHAAKTSAVLWAHAIKVMQKTGKSYAQCQVEGLFYTTEVDQI